MDLGSGASLFVCVGHQSAAAGQNDTSVVNSVFCKILVTQYLKLNIYLIVLPLLLQRVFTDLSFLAWHLLHDDESLLTFHQVVT